jgi:hypothetical protein
MIGVILIFGSSIAESKDNWTYYSLQGLAYTANAGGQTSVAVRRRAADYEWSLFGNDYLRAGGIPLIGLSWDRRFEMLGPGWPLRPYFQVGPGISTGGPFAELMWGCTIAYVLRIDIATHLIATSKRIVSWNYPFWVGMTVPL